MTSIKLSLWRMDIVYHIRLALSVALYFKVKSSGQKFSKSRNDEQNNTLVILKWIRKHSPPHNDFHFSKNVKARGKGKKTNLDNKRTFSSW